MNPLQFLRLFHFILSLGPDIVAQVEQLLNFARDAKERFDKQSSETPDTSPSIMAVQMTGDDAIEALATAHPELCSACEDFEKAERTDEGTGDVTTTARPRGAFRDLFKNILDDPQKYIDLFLLFKNLFAAKAAGTMEVSETTGEAETTA